MNIKREETALKKTFKELNGSVKSKMPASSKDNLISFKDTKVIAIIILSYITKKRSPL